MTTAKKIAANRKNAKKSAGPKSVRGKALAKFNAVSHGIFALQRVLPGEDADQYTILVLALRSQCNPVGALEEVLVDEIAGTLWRLRRLQNAESAYFEKVQHGKYKRMYEQMSQREREIIAYVLEPAFIATLQPRNATNLRSTVIFTGPDGKPAEKEVPREFAADEIHSVKLQLDEASRLDTTYLEAYVAANETQPMLQIDRMHGKLMRDFLQQYAALEAMQERRLALKPEL